MGAGRCEPRRHTTEGLTHTTRRKVTSGRADGHDRDDESSDSAAAAIAHTDTTTTARRNKAAQHNRKAKRRKETKRKTRQDGNSSTHDTHRRTHVTDTRRLSDTPHTLRRCTHHTVRVVSSSVASSGAGASLHLTRAARDHYVCVGDDDDIGRDGDGDRDAPGVAEDDADSADGMYFRENFPEMCPRFCPPDDKGIYTHTDTHRHRPSLDTGRLSPTRTRRRRAYLLHHRRPNQRRIAVQQVRHTHHAAAQLRSRARRDLHQRVRAQLCRHAAAHLVPIGRVELRLFLAARRDRRTSSVRRRRVPREHRRRLQQRLARRAVAVQVASTSHHSHRPTVSTRPSHRSRSARTPPSTLTFGSPRRTAPAPDPPRSCRRPSRSRTSVGTTAAGPSTAAETPPSPGRCGAGSSSSSFSSPP